MATNRKKYDSAFKESFEIGQSDLKDELEYNTIETWDSIGHMQLMAELEDSFDIMIDTDDILTFGTYAIGIEILKKYDVEIL
jgi:acyl carrier protein